MEHWAVSLQSFPPELIWCILFPFCCIAILALLRFFGILGVVAYMAVGIIVANIQVLKIVKFSIVPQPLAMGTIIFSSLFLCSSILTEYYSEKVARKAVLLSLVAMLLMTVFMQLTIAYRPISINETPPDLRWAFPNNEHITAIFSPTTTLFFAGSISYLISQLYEVRIFSFIRYLTKGRMLWLRNFLAMAISALIDNIIFSSLAWKLLSEHPASWKTVVITYILGTYWLRLLFSIFDTPIIYFARYFLPLEDRPKSFRSL